MELFLVNLICFGPFALLSLQEMVLREQVILFDDRRLYTIATIELICGTIAVLFLRARGWTLSDLGFRISMPLTMGGMVLFIGTNITLVGLHEGFRGLTGSDPGLATTPVAKASWLAVLLILAIDPLYEETFEVAYNLRATESHGAAFGITLSAAIRFVCHLYQGPISAITILPLGLIFAAVYWKWRRVWPLIVAHGVASYFGLAPGQSPS
jgi:membrane protease YdiL (CAAX protease family)